jgi:chromosome segregation ATPase
MAGRIDPLVKEKLDGISGRIDTMESNSKQEIAKIKEGLGSLERQAAKAEDLNAVLERANAIDVKLNALGVALRDYDKRIKEADSKATASGEISGRFSANITGLENRVMGLENVKTAKVEDVDILATRMTNLEARLDTLGERERRITQLETELSRLQGALNQVTKERDNLAVGRPSIDFSSLAGQLNSSLLQINEQARRGVKEGKPQFVVDGLDMEVKGNIDLNTGQLRMAQLMPHETSDKSVSTLRFSLKPLPIIRIVEDEQQK